MAIFARRVALTEVYKLNPRSCRKDVLSLPRHPFVFFAESQIAAADTVVANLCTNSYRGVGWTNTNATPSKVTPLSQFPRTPFIRTWTSLFFSRL